MTPVSLPLSVPFPVTVTSIHHRVGETVQKHALLLKFKYWDYQEDPSSKEANPQKVRVERIGTLESPIEGLIESIHIAVNDEVAHSGMELFHIEEPCSHTVQYGGLCALCGKAVEDEKDYTGYSYEDRATIEMSHDSTGLRISLEEATKIEHNATKRLAEARKLILVVDLDQTVIQATVDPTVGKWQLNPKDPNYPYVADVKSFVLEEEPILPRGWTGPRPPPTKCCYYIKLRPGLETFLEKVLKLYELHVYTMATRNYALAICKLIDPTGEYFGDRILSRDESGLITHKNLKRLFPVDQSMVAIIDDRGDVWQWEANLVKVVPYDFFVGIGDINLSFLPKKNGQLLGPSKKRKAVARLEVVSETETDIGDIDTSENAPEDSVDSTEFRSDNGAGDDEDDDLEAREGGLSDSESQSPSPSSGLESVTSSPIDRMVHLNGGEINENLLVEQQKIRSKLVEQQQHDRPLAKLQEDLDKTIHSDHENSLSDSDDKEDDEHLLSDDDKELTYLESALSKCHTEYYKRYDVYKNNQNLRRPDLTTIIPKLKQESLKDLVVLFSGVFALGKNIDDVEIVIWCRQFGVKVVTEVYPDVTHVVCRDPDLSLNKPGLTLKVRVAKKTLPNVKIVTPDWLFACLSQWKPVQTDEYEIHVSDRDWYVSENDVKKYQSAFDLQSQRENLTFRSAPGGRSDSLGSIEEFDLNEASEEVDDFLAGISDDSDDNEDGDVVDEDEDTHEPSGSANGSFVKSLYSSKRKAEELSLLEDDEEEEGDTKKRKLDVNTKESTDFDELEQELLDELDHLSD